MERYTAMMEVMNKIAVNMKKYLFQRRIWKNDLNDFNLLYISLLNILLGNQTTTTPPPTGPPPGKYS